MDKPSAETDGEQAVRQIPPNKPVDRRNTTQDAQTTSSTIASVPKTSRQSSASNSLAPSPLASRESSPSRQPRRPVSSTKLSSTSASRQSSQPDNSPTRQMRSSLSGPSLSSRSLSSATTPNLASEAPKDTRLTTAATPQKPLVASDPRGSRRWPVSPRLRSPPPQLNPSGTSSILEEADFPATSVRTASSSPPAVESQQGVSGSDTEESQPNSGMRTPIRGGLETVQEVSLPGSPTPTNPSLLHRIQEKLAEDAEDESGDAPTSRARPRLESGSEGGNANLDKRRTTSMPPPNSLSRQSSAVSAKQMKAKAEGSAQTMTVETETVPSIPQVALATGTNKAEGSAGQLRTKQSSETIKPRKEKKKITRKQPPVNSGNASSKADVFEAKIASAVDEANTSDSEETFVYDSNPPENTERNHRRFHSRTPSATSMASQADRTNMRSIYGVMEGVGHTQPHTQPQGHKKSMKFVNTSNGSGGEGLTPVLDDEGKGTSRSSTGSTRGTMRQHHHIGRWGRQLGNGHPSIFDNESPFPNAAKAKLAANSRNASVPSNPRSYQPRGHLHTKRSAIQLSSTYDMDDTTGADDERTPLIGSNRSGRSNRNRRRPDSLHQAESQTFLRGASYLNRFAACLVLTVMFLLVITGAIGFMFATSQPMTDIEITIINSVVTSEQMLMFDLTVRAHNPNIVVVTIDQANLEIFAKSEHADDEDWWKDIFGPGPHQLGKRDDPWNDPPVEGPGDGDDENAPNFLLGRITEFDSPLTFEGSLFHQGTSSSTGELQLASPGNSTSVGSARWNAILHNEFDLIVKGVVKYSLPLSARIRSATVSGRTTVKPNSANDPSLKPNSTAEVD